MLSNWLANRALDVECRAIKRHRNTRSGASLWLAETAEDVRLWIDRAGDWRELRAKRVRSHRQSLDQVTTSMWGRV